MVTHRAQSPRGICADRFHCNPPTNYWSARGGGLHPRIEPGGPSGMKGKTALAFPIRCLIRAMSHTMCITDPQAITVVSHKVPLSSQKE